jgi:hypothetical protein
MNAEQIAQTLSEHASNVAKQVGGDIIGQMREQADKRSAQYGIPAELAMVLMIDGAKLGIDAGQMIAMQTLPDSIREAFNAG